jgi:hypothetical protein
LGDADSDGSPPDPASDPSDDPVDASPSPPGPSDDFPLDESDTAGPDFR